MGIQMTAQEKRTYADYILGNRGSLQELGAAVREMYTKIAKDA
jgi:dephospho-CoA kinase